jgi:hypothetical protein
VLIRTPAPFAVVVLLTAVAGCTSATTDADTTSHALPSRAENTAPTAHCSATHESDAANGDAHASNGSIGGRSRFDSRCDAPASAAGFPPCPAHQLSATVSGQAAGTTHLFYSVIVTNKGNPCRLSGYPRAIIGTTVTGRSRVLQLSHLPPSNVHAQTTGKPARLRHHERAELVIDTFTACRDAPHETPGTEYAKVSMTLPGKHGQMVAVFKSGGEGTVGRFGMWLPCRAAMSPFYRAWPWQ